MSRVWQIASGDPGRNYSRLFIDHDLMFMGPGRFGAFDPDRYRPVVEDGLFSTSKIGHVRSFCQDVDPGDTVLLRSGHRVEAIGLVPGQETYYWNRILDDVFGWDLQHSRRVMWQDHLKTELDALQRVRPLFADRKQIPTFTAVKDHRVLEPVRDLFKECRERPLKPLPAMPPEPLSDDQLGQELFARGLPNESVDKVVLAIQRQRRLARWYGTAGWDVGRPTEHEVVSHMILPLLLALGWSEQLLAVEWRRLDLAGFCATPTGNETCVLLCEAKSLQHGLQNVLDQAVKYHKRLNLRACNRILLTNGARLYLYERKENKWNEVPVGYLNIDLIRTNHLAPPHTNAVDTIVALTPAGVLREVPKSNE